jgi:hypothetical protein
MGSNPIGVAQFSPFSTINGLIVQWPRTPAFHVGNTGSNPVEVTNQSALVRDAHEVPLRIERDHEELVGAEAVVEHERLGTNPDADQPERGHGRVHRELLAMKRQVLLDHEVSLGEALARGGIERGDVIDHRRGAIEPRLRETVGDEQRRAIGVARDIRTVRSVDLERTEPHGLQFHRLASYD